MDKEYIQLQNDNNINDIEFYIKNILPYMSENFITFPLWEEGNYTPVINMWNILYTSKYDADTNFLDLIFDTDMLKYKFKDYIIQSNFEKMSHTTNSNSDYFSLESSIDNSPLPQITQDTEYKTLITFQIYHKDLISSYENMTGSIQLSELLYIGYKLVQYLSTQK